MKFRLSLIAVLLFIGISSTQAQQRRTVEERVKSAMARISDSLNLTEASKGSIDSIFTDYYTSMDKLREGLAPGTRPDSVNVQKIRSERDTKLKLYMTDQQFQKFKEDEDKMRQQRNQRQGGNN